jgi:transposase-like protein
MEPFICCAHVASISANAAQGDYPTVDSGRWNCYVSCMIKLSELNSFFPTEEACKKFLFEHRWPDGKVACPRCGNEKIYKLSHRAWHWQCQKCSKRGYRFSLITGTVFENTKYPLKTWFTVAFMMLHSKKGMSALQIKRMVFHDKASYETVWYMCTRIRAAMDNDGFKELMGIVEVDETFVGGKDKNRHFGKKSHVTGGIGSGKVGVIGAISRKGNVVQGA